MKNKYIVIETTTEGFGMRSERIASRHSTASAADKAARKLWAYHHDNKHLMGAYAAEENADGSYTRMEDGQ